MLAGQLGRGVFLEVELIVAGSDFDRVEVVADPFQGEVAVDELAGVGLDIKRGHATAGSHLHRALIAEIIPHRKRLVAGIGSLVENALAEVGSGCRRRWQVETRGQVVG